MATLCSTEGFDERILHVIIEKTLEYGEDGPAVSLWVITCLLNMAFQNAKSTAGCSGGSEVRSASSTWC